MTVTASTLGGRLGEGTNEEISLNRPFPEMFSQRRCHEQDIPQWCSTAHGK